eukprot:TRINITY_DN35181_c0_g1_i1.p2 TRINITY_DN35181_c0_g1~~TRINITY_DN35181_c0_g1_i1.p2  ORF type:complete len:431 (+),score=47.54 TRINITY_DN35181_c0_g1_i1:1452-2744(+)
MTLQQQTEKELENKKESVEEKETEILDIISQQEKELERISNMTKDEAKNTLLTKLENELNHETAVLIREYENKLEEEKDRLGKRIISTAIGKAASDYVVESTISVVQLPNDEMKGRIIGREGRNIRTIESLTGVDVIIDDTPEAVVLSCFDAVKRETAKLAIEKLVVDGRIHPAKIEEAVEKAKKDVEAAILEAGEQALLELGIANMNQEIIKVLGRLRYRTSYGQNVLVHSIEVGHLAGVMAAELKADVELAKRAGLLHDIGKAIDHDIEGSHAIIGRDFLKKFNEKDTILNAVAAHHGEEEFESVEAILVQAADAISASRPGARRETLATYLKRLETLEGIANEVSGVEVSYAIQAGREIRIIVKPDEIDDDNATKVSRDVAKKIEMNMQYPGQIKVTVVRETRAVDYAKQIGRLLSRPFKYRKVEKY